MLKFFSTISEIGTKSTFTFIYLSIYIWDFVFISLSLNLRFVIIVNNLTKVYFCLKMANSFKRIKYLINCKKYHFYVKKFISTFKSIYNFR